MNNQFSFIIITYNEEVHLPRLLASISGINAPLFILDSGSTDNTVAIAEQHKATILQHTFENHPKQWDFALKNFDVKTPWVICLDADQIVTDDLKERLMAFSDDDFKGVDGIYFNRKNFFKGRWIKHGGYSPFYLLKMIRYGSGYSDLNENMDHRFIVSGKTLIWKDGFIIEENLKENNISFWIAKHNRYSDLVAEEEVERMRQLRTQTLKPRVWGSPDERTAALKQVWWKMPRYVRPAIYFFHRMLFQRGLLDGRTGIIFHFLQAFWFRLIVDIKIDELLKKEKGILKTDYNQDNQPQKFIISFLLCFAFLYVFNIFYLGVTSPGNYYSPFLDHYLNYISGIRFVLLKSSAWILNLLGYAAITNEYDLLVAGHGTFIVAYFCLGIRVSSFFAAFVLTYPKKTRWKLSFVIAGIIGIEMLNILRFVLLGIFWKGGNEGRIDHHTIFNVFIYIIIAIVLYFWVTNDKGEPLSHEKNRPVGI